MIQTSTQDIVQRSPDEPPTALLIDDNVFFRRGLRMMLLAQGIAVIGEASNGRDGSRLATELAPDVVVLDLEMPHMDGIAATELICSAPRPPAVIILATAESTAALDAILAGAQGVLLKDAPADEIANGVRMAAAGDSALSASVAGQLVARMRELETVRRALAPRQASANLSQRERDVLRLVACGRGNSMIGQELFISASTVKHNVAAIMGKLGVQNRAAAAAEAVRLGVA